MYGQVGGWRVYLVSMLFAAGVTAEFVGPYTNVGAHRGVNGTSAFQQTSQLQTDCATYQPRIVPIALGVNDIGGLADGGQGRTAAQTLTELAECIAWVKAGTPQAIVLVQTVVVPQGPTYPTYWANRLEHVSLNESLPSLCAEHGATVVDVGAPETTDDIHMSDGVAGYQSVARAYFNTIMSMIP
jgi:lysophospholipase L1-like esterase